MELRMLRRLQTEIIDRNRRDSLLLVRVQNDLNVLGLGMRDMLDAKESYPLTAWRSQFQRIRTDLDDAVKREAEVAPAGRTPDQARYLASSMAQFWDAMDRMFAQAADNESEARAHVRLSLQARQAALSAAVSRLLVQNNESDEQAMARTQQIHSQVERNLYLFLAAMVVSFAAVSAYLIRHNRRVFDQVTALSDRRSELAQQLIGMQESTFRSISRELHDEFGQILTAVGTMLQRAGRLAGGNTAFREELREVHLIVQSTLDKVRALSQALHPVMLEEVGFDGAVDAYLPVFERRTGVAVRCVKTGASREIGREESIHLYRILQEALNNVARHSDVKQAEVRLTFTDQHVTLEIEDRGPGFPDSRRDGLGLVSMRERAEMVGGRIELLRGAAGGALVRFTVPAKEQAHVTA
ncbi:MAG: sensor histidine kinase [Proteobacteria bacterium]|nr:sensor histidine kinase [Pseudomonadota bacterium]